MNRNILRKFVLPFALLCLASSCSQGPIKNSVEEQKANVTAERLADAQKERERTFAKFQEYVDTQYPNWRVKGITKYETETTMEGEKTFYYVLLNQSDRNKMIFLINADFELADGKTESHIFEPTRLTLDRRRNEIRKQQYKEEGREELKEWAREQYYNDNMETNY